MICVTPAPGAKITLIGITSNIIIVGWQVIRLSKFLLDATMKLSNKNNGPLTSDMRSIQNVL